MWEWVEKEIKRIEHEQNVTIWYAVESGSRAWGFPSKDSDFDVRFLYTHSEDWYVSVEERRDVIEYPIDDSLDVSGWDLKKGLQLLRKCNPSLLEWLNSPIVYRDKGNLATELRKLCRENMALKPLIYHYLHMAEGNFREYLQGEQVKIKKYFYVLRPLFACSYIEKYEAEPPVLFDEIMAEIEIPEPIREITSELLVRKKAGDELDLEPRLDELNAYINEQIGHFKQFVQSIDSPEPIAYAKLNAVFRKFVRE
ncbi:nucleotidyltransferase domain-containing protein [Listeria sp. ILCC797]|uniref:nucleotidyltransferase domain-containing protein n=1 Tax=Listeria sp. ILCC797 TaxID=1918333 RepID=UPI001C6FCE40|nr:nucleotidyltransferase domain-containing protein [Listeria sp. ILCC797]